MSREEYNRVGIKTIGETIGTLYFNQQSFGKAIADLQGGKGYIRITNSHEGLVHKTLDKVIKEEIELVNDQTTYIVVDLTSLTGNFLLKDTFVIDRPMTILLGDVLIYGVSEGEAYDLFKIISNNVQIIGKKMSTIGYGTRFKLTGITSNEVDGYHITIDANNVLVANIGLIGQKTTFGNQYESISYPIDGLGGIRLSEGRFNINVEHIDFGGTKAHCVFGKSITNLKLDGLTMASVAGHGILLDSCTQVEVKNIIGLGIDYLGAYFNKCSSLSIYNLTVSNAKAGVVLRECNTVSIKGVTVDSLIPLNSYIGGVNETGQYGVNIPEVEDIQNEDAMQYINPKGVLSFKSVNTVIEGVSSRAFSIDATHIDNTHTIKLIETLNAYITNVFTRFNNLFIPRHEVFVDNTNKNIEIIWSKEASSHEVYKTANIEQPAALFYDIPVYEVNGYDYFDIMSFKPTDDRDIIIGDNKVGFIPEIREVSSIQLGENAILHTLG